ncbi:cyanophycin synthetase [Arsenicibacter rosenii]|uniref:Cyanophycin synthetase n=1 Tax=Arsenicibacter rosenii TaxID=1750698 RepID=A0A1S2VNR2_9BACT|nr:cyanophycin synthetase [Arsenicibacter rosenii]OIN60384.1 cyanophycin synthetase [Arsenicibacter rosenii]
MNIVDIRCFRGPNYWSIRHPKLVAMTLDLDELEQSPTNTIPGFYERLKTLIPSLYEHRCSKGYPGGFFERVQEGTWMGHVIEHIALAIQTLAGMDCGFGKTRGTGKEGVYQVVFAYVHEEAGRYAAEAAVRIARALIDNQPYELADDINRLRQLCAASQLGPSTRAIVDACTEKNIPHIRLSHDSYIQLGYGARQKRIRATMTSQTSVIAVELACDKAETKRLLDQEGIPVPQGEIVYTPEALHDALNRVGFPLVVKPLDGNHGRGVTTCIETAEEAEQAFHRAQAHSKAVIVEQFIKGNDYRLLVIDYKLQAAALRMPASVTGDGKQTIRELIQQVNDDPRRGDDHENVLTRIGMDDCVMALLRRQHLTLDTVPGPGRVLMLKKTANISTGGTASDVTDIVHPAMVAMAERIARLIGLDICGIDLIAEDITQEPACNALAVIEVNAAPGFRMHTHPSEGKARPVGRAVANMLFPDNETGRIPVIAITGTNGKTTTTRLTAHLFRQSNRKVGYTTTDGVYIGQQCIEQGDCTGPGSTRKVLQDPSVEVAVLECARGGLLRSGLAFDQCDVAVVTNVAADHLGLNNINTLEDMAHVKRVVPETVKPDGYAVLNADNEYTYRMQERLRCRIALFSTQPDNPLIEQHCATGGLAAVIDRGFVAVRQGDQLTQLIELTAVPLSFNGKAVFMIENILAATLAGYCQGLTAEDIAEGLRTFIPSGTNTPGRMNLFPFNDFSVLIDYAHNPHGLQALGQYIRQVESTHKVGIITGVGDRRDDDILALGQIAATLFDEIIIRLDEDRRGRSPEELIAVLTDGIRLGDERKPIRCIPDELEALSYAIRHARSGSLIVHLTEKVKRAIEVVVQARAQEEAYGLVRTV